MAFRSSREKLPLIVVVGPTASGKTSLAVDMAREYGGEIICADSRTVYKGMDIGTAKPTLEEQMRVPHWGLDLVEPGERFTVADFKNFADQKISEIRARGRIPFLVGGTGLYINAVIFDYKFGGDINPRLRKLLSRKTIEELHRYCAKNNVILPENRYNKRYVIRAIEQKNVSVKGNDQPETSAIIVGIATSTGLLRTRIYDRTEQLFDHGVVAEATMLGKKYGWYNEAMTANVYSLIHAYLSGELTLQETKEKVRVLDWRLAKRQMSWLRRNPYIKWLSLIEANVYIARLLAKPR